MVCTSASLFYIYLFIFDEFFFESFLIMSYGEELKSVVVFYFESLRERFCELEALLLVFIEAYLKDECRYLCHVGMYVKFVHDVEYERSVVFIHEGVVAGAYAHQRLFLFHYE